MKKFGLAVCVLLFVASSAFAAAPMQLVMGTGGTSGTYYPYGGAISQIISDKTGIVAITAQATGATIENLRLLSQGEIDLALLQNDAVHYAFNGIEAFKDKKITNFRAIARIYPEVVQIAVSQESGIKTVQDMKGKKISVGAPGSGTESNTRQITGVLGIDYVNAKYFTPLYLSYTETAANFKDRQVDGFFITSGLPNAAVVDICTLQKLHFIPIDGEFRDKMIKEYPFFAKYAYPASTYNGMTGPVETIALQAILAVREDLPADIVYAITKALFENKAAIEVAHAKGKDLDIKMATDGITIPFHAGAEKYLKEAGVLK